MRHHFRLMAILVVCLCAYGVLILAFRWMNEPRDAAVIAAIAVLLALLLIVPLVIRAIWRNL